jgi:predicted nucleotidyltransferase
MALKINEIKKHLKKGDLKAVEEHLNNIGESVSYQHISAVLNGRRKNSKILSALLAKAESNIEEEEQLQDRVEDLNNRSKNL